MAGIYTGSRPAERGGSEYPARIVKAVAGCEDAMGASP